MNRISMMRLQGKAMTELETIFLGHLHRHIQQQEWIRRVRYLGK